MKKRSVVFLLLSIFFLVFLCFSKSGKKESRNSSFYSSNIYTRTLIEAEDGTRVKVIDEGEKKSWETSGDYSGLTTRGRSPYITIKWIINPDAPRNQEEAHSPEGLSKLQVAFEGKCISVIATKSYCSGILDIKIDGKDYPSIDLFEEVDSKNQEILIASGLSTRDHILEIKPNYTPHYEQSSYGKYGYYTWGRAYIYIDAFRYGNYDFNEVSLKAENEIGDRLEGVRFDFFQMEKRADTYFSQIDGRVNNFGLLPGTYIVKASLRGCKEVTKKVTISKGKNKIYFVLPFESDQVKPLSSIKRPIQAVPIIQKKRGSFEIVLLGFKKTSRWRAELSNPRTGKVNLPINSTEYRDPNLILIATLPSNIQEELYDLTVYGPNKIKETSYHSVKVINDFKESYSFVHIADIHTNPFGDSRGKTNKILEKIIKEINLINPEFVLLTGDFVGSGVPGYYINFLSILSELEVPIYIVAGNHEIFSHTLPNGVSYPPYPQHKAVYEKYIGPLYYDFQYNNHLYIGFFTANFGRWMDEQENSVGGFRLENSKREWISRELEKFKNFPLKILFNHFPSAIWLSTSEEGPKFGEYELRSLYDNYKINMELHGHLHRDTLVHVGSTPTLLLETRGIQKQDKMGYRLIRIKGNNIERFSYNNEPLASIPWNNLDISYSPSNSGLSNEVTATITNQLSEPFESALIKFIMPKKVDNFKVENGIIVQIAENNDTKTLYVRTRVEPNSSKVVKAKGEVMQTVFIRDR